MSKSALRKYQKQIYANFQHLKKFLVDISGELCRDEPLNDNSNNKKQKIKKNNNNYKLQYTAACYFFYFIYLDCQKSAAFKQGKNYSFLGSNVFTEMTLSIVITIFW